MDLFNAFPEQKLMLLPFIYKDKGLIDVLLFYRFVVSFSHQTGGLYNRDRDS